MKGLLKKLCDKFKLNNSGSAIVIVIMALAFVGILGVTIMWMSLANYRMKVTDQKNKQSFYTAEMILDQINSGLQFEASRAANTAYNAVLQNYSYDAWSEDERRAEFTTQYKNNLKVLVRSSLAADRYDLSRLLTYIDDSIGISVNPANKMEKTGDKIRFLGTTTDADAGKIVDSSGEDYIILKGLHLEYTDDHGFYSVVETDVMISTPQISFKDASKSIDLFYYALIANQGLKVGGGDLTLEGSIYAGDEGIESIKNIDIKGALKVISKGPIVLSSTSNLESFKINKLSTYKVDGKALSAADLSQFYAKDITVTNSNIVINSETYVADDLTLNGNKTKVDLVGKYIGYGSGISKNVSSNSASAIIVNGLQSKLDMSQLNELILAGDAYIGTSKARDVESFDRWGKDFKDSKDFYDAKNKDVVMGESISVKGNQLAYLIPGECIGTKNGVSIYNKNPLTSAEYNDMVSKISDDVDASVLKPGCKIIDTTVKIASLGGETLSKYVNSTNYKADTKLIFVPSNGQTLVYFYLNLEPDIARKYFNDYYNYNSDRIDAYIDVYAGDGLTLPDDTTANVNMTGNSVYGGSGASKGLRTTTDGAMDGLGLDTYTKVAEALCCKLTTDYYSLTAEEKSKSVFENIIDTTEFNNEIGGGTKEFEVDGVKAIFTGAANTYDYKNPHNGLAVNDTCNGYKYDGEAGVRIIVAKNDVIVTHDFDGIIIAGGRIIVENGCTVRSIKNSGSAVEAELNKLLQVEQTNSAGTGKIHPIDFFEDDVASVAIGANDGKSYDRVDFTTLVNYQNWVKE